MKLSKITPFLSVSDQLTEQDLGIAAAQGFKSIINNRPDGEAEDQPRSQDLAAAAERLGLRLPAHSRAVGQGHGRGCCSLCPGTGRGEGTRAGLLPDRHPLQHPVGPVRSLAPRPRCHPQGCGRGRLQSGGLAAAAGGPEPYRCACSVRQPAEDRQRRAPAPHGDLRRRDRRRRRSRPLDGLQPAQAPAWAIHRRRRAAGEPLLSAGLDPRRRRRVQSQPDGARDGARDAATGRRASNPSATRWCWRMGSGSSTASWSPRPASS